jgi:divinyl chlorophyllide a 8-vinyl-reductase
MVFPALKDKAEFARIGRYYGTESMLVWDETKGEYNEAATPSFGSDTLQDFYARVLKDGLKGQELGDHAMFN